LVVCQTKVWIPFTKHKKMTKYNILIVDDIPANLQFLNLLLAKRGYQARPAINGRVALKIAQKTLPDLILLDIQMPGMDGYEVCKRLKADDKTGEIPVIFISALSEVLDKVKAFSVGGVDYITKPFQEEEVLARIKTHLMLQTQKKQLIQLDQEKNEFLGMAAHDLKNPLSAIKGYSEEIEEYCHEMTTEEIVELSGLIKNSSTKMFTLITNLLDVNQIESGKIKLDLVNVDILPIVESVVRDYTKTAKEKEINLHFSSEGSNFHVYVDVNLVGQILDNIISNAVKYSPLGKNVYINLIANENKIRCEVKDEGYGLSADDLGKLFGKFNRLSTKPTGGEHSTGLGLFIVKKLVEAMNAKIWCESELGKGSKFMVEFIPEKIIVGV